MALTEQYFTTRPLVETYVLVTLDNLAEVAAAIDTFSNNPATVNNGGVDYDYTVPGAGVPIPGRLEPGDLIRAESGLLFGPPRTNGYLNTAMQPAPAASSHYMMAEDEES